MNEVSVCTSLGANELERKIAELQQTCQALATENVHIVGCN